MEEAVNGDGTSTVPDVSVIIPVYNTMPYLTACLESLVGQSIGHGRLEVIAVDDGSTDGSGKELERFAASYPGLFRVLHQENSGGPAGPCNRGLEVASGRYVFFVGADDYLGERALEKLVVAADQWDSDVVLGKMVGVGGRGVSQLMFSRTQDNVPFPESRLVFAVANTKLFRRSLLEEHGIRYPLDLRIGSDQPFTIAAMIHARKISVLADEPYYYAVRREKADNITFSSGWKARLEDIGTVMHHVAEIVPPGDKRDRILHRHFAWELGNRLRDDFLALSEDDQTVLAGLVAGLADQYLTDRVSDLLQVPTRVRLRLAQAGRLDKLRAVLRTERDGGPPPLAVRNGAAYIVLPGYGDLPDSWFLSRAENLVKRLDEAVRVTSLAWNGSTIEVTADGTLLHPDSAGSVRLELRPLPGQRRIGEALRRSRGAAARQKPVLGVLVVLEPVSGGHSTLRVEIDLGQLLGRAPGKRRRWAPRLVVDAGERVVDLPLVVADGVEKDTTTFVRSEASWYRLLARVGPHRRLVLVRQPVPADEVPRRDRLRAKVGRLAGRAAPEGS